jgi:hypothetical protein
MIRNTLRTAILANSLMSGVVFAKPNEGGASGANAPAPATAAAATDGEVKVSGILKGRPLPERKKSARGGGKSPYPFDGLEVGDSFGVTGKSKKTFNSIIYGQHQKYAVPVIGADGKQEQTLKITYQRDPSDKKKFLLDANSNKIEQGREMVGKTRETRQFEAFDVDPATHDGYTVLVYRMPDAVAPAAS